MTKKVEKDGVLRYGGWSALGQSLDLATEAHALLRGAANREVPGVREEVDLVEIEGGQPAKIHTITILNAEGEKQMGKPMGHYINIEIPELIHNKDVLRPASRIVAERLQELIPDQNPKPSFLLIGLGNNQATPDSLGPRVVEQTMATRHLLRLAPDEMPPGMASVCAIAPGVLGITGIETAEIIKGITDHIQPNCIIAVDALAAGNISRVGNTIQISDTGINPGAGIGNRRTPINAQTMGRPVIAIGIPTVVDTNIIIYESLLSLLDIWHEQGKQNVPPIEEGVLDAVRKRLLAAFDGSLIVTPREIDDIISAVADLIAAAFIQAVHPCADESNYYLYLR